MVSAAEKARKQVEQAEEILKQAKAKLQRVAAAEKAKQTKISRHQQERKKYLIGALVLKSMEADAGKNKDILDGLNTFLTRDNDRALFGLAPLNNKPPVPVDGSQIAA